MSMWALDSEHSSTTTYKAFVQVTSPLQASILHLWNGSKGNVCLAHKRPLYIAVIISMLLIPGQFAFIWALEDKQPPSHKIKKDLLTFLIALPRELLTTLLIVYIFWELWLLVYNHSAWLGRKPVCPRQVLCNLLYIIRQDKLKSGCSLWLTLSPQVKMSF